MDLTVKAGRTWKFVIGPVTRDGASVDLDGASAKFTVKRSRTDADADALVQVTQVLDASGEIDIDNDSKLLTVRVEASAADIAPGTYYWDLALKEADGTLTSDETCGEITVHRGVTDRY